MKNKGRGIAENCSAFLTVIPHQSSAKVLPSQEDKSLVWDNGDIYRTIGAKDGKALLYIVFTQDDFSEPTLRKEGGEIPEDEKIYAKVSTKNSFKFTSRFPVIGYIDDGLAIGKASFRLKINTIHGQSVESILHVTVTNHWDDITLEKIDKI